MNVKKLEAIIDALTDSLEIVSHNPVETEHVLTLKQKYKDHYKKITGEFYRRGKDSQLVMFGGDGR